MCRLILSTFRCIAVDTSTNCPCTDSADLDVLGFVPRDLIYLLLSAGFPFLCSIFLMIRDASTSNLLTSRDHVDFSLRDRRVIVSQAPLPRKSTSVCQHLSSLTTRLSVLVLVKARLSEACRCLKVVRLRTSVVGRPSLLGTGCTVGVLPGPTSVPQSPG